MRLFRRNLDFNRATTRLGNSTDLHHVARLMRDGARRYYGFNGIDLPALLEAGHIILLEGTSELWGAIIMGWHNADTTWLRGFALIDGVDVGQALGLLIPALHEQARSQNIRHIFYAGNEATDIWMIPALKDKGYLEDTQVVVYEKRGTSIPARGNQEIQLRPAFPFDLNTIIELDQACFEPQWIKDDTIIGPAISQAALFNLAEYNNHAIGYIYATRHFGGRLIHLVRIAVHPHYQGQGIGVRLLAEVVDFAYRNNAITITLNTQSYNTQAQRLYTWFGFSPTGERQTVVRYDL